MAENRFHRIWQAIVRILARPEDMVKDSVRRWTWLLIILTLLSLVAFLAGAVIQSAPSSVVRDISLLLLGTAIAAFISLLSAGIAWERGERDKFYQATYGYATEQAGNVIRLHFHRTYSGSATVNGQNRPYVVPIYSLAVESLCQAIRSDVIGRKRMGNLQVQYLQLEEFNRMASLAESWFASIIGSSTPTLVAVNALESISKELNKRREALLIDLKGSLRLNDDEFGDNASQQVAPAGVP